MSQPMTAAQLSKVTGYSSAQCGYILPILLQNKLLRCITPKAKRGRLYWLSKYGKAKQRFVRKDNGLPALQHDVPPIDWNTYGKVCFTRRSIVVKTLSRPMQPVEVKRIAFRNNPTIRMSANNCREALYYLRSIGVVQAVQVKKKEYPRYELTETGKLMQRLLWQVGVSWQ